jgi:hypothetical protein
MPPGLTMVFQRKKPTAIGVNALYPGPGMIDGQKNMVWVYVDTNHQVGHPDHLKVLATREAADAWFQKKRTRRRCLRIRDHRVAS